MPRKINVKTHKLSDGDTLHEIFNNYFTMAESAVDWTLFCSYQLKPNFSEGIYKILQLPTMQIAYTSMDGGIMFDFDTPKECITFSFIQEVSEKACTDQMKLKKGMIVVLDDKKTYNLMCSGAIKLFDVSLNKDADPQLVERLNNAVDHYFLDKDQQIENVLQTIVDEYAQAESLNAQTSKQIEKSVTETILALLNEQEAQVPCFTRAEQYALKIKDQVFKHMDGNLSITSLAKTHNISTKSLQNAFRSLFDLSPNQYMRLLKLNLVHHELMQGEAKELTVQDAAKKWGFSHMGRFSQYYKELFNETPSYTLRRKNPLTDGMKVHCVERKEEML